MSEETRTDLVGNHEERKKKSNKPKLKKKKKLNKTDLALVSHDKKKSMNF